MIDEKKRIEIVEKYVKAKAYDVLTEAMSHLHNFDEFIEDKPSTQPGEFRSFVQLYSLLTRLEEQICCAEDFVDEKFPKSPIRHEYISELREHLNT